MIQSLLNSGKRFSSRSLNLDFKKDTVSPEDYKVAFLVSGKSGNAVERNRVKRWLREDFRKLQMEKKIAGYFAVRFKGVIKEISHLQLTGELEKVYKSINNG